MNIALIDDHLLVAEAIKNTLAAKEYAREIRLFSSGNQYLETKAEWAPDLIISDMLMPGLSGASLIDAYRSGHQTHPKIIILSSVTDTVSIRQVIRQGVNAYLSKEEPIEELLNAISAVMSGEQYIGNLLQKKLLDTMFIEEQVVFHLSPREKDVLDLVCSGHVMKEVAVELGLSIHTVQSYHKNIIRKLKVRRTHDLIVFAMRHGLYNPDKVLKKTD